MKGSDERHVPIWPAGYTGTYMPSQLPRVAGVPVIPLHGAWVTRDDEDGCVTADIDLDPEDEE